MLMKKLFAISLLALFSFSAAQAQEDDKMLFNHLSVGVTTGTPGLIGFDVATTCTPYLQIRAGISIMPRFKYSTDISMGKSDVNKFNGYITQINNAADDPKNASLGIPHIYGTVQEKYDIEGKFGFTNGKILFDFFPFTSKGFPFFITVGAYFGGSEIISVYNKDDRALKIVNEANEAIEKTKGIAPSYGIPTDLNKIYGEVGDYRLGPDADGNAKFSIKVNGFKPYLGIGFGRPVPKGRIGFQFELGCMFWSTPKVTYSGYDAATGESNFEIDNDKVGDKDVGKAIDVVKKFGVWPCISFRLCGRIF